MSQILEISARRGHCQETLNGPLFHLSNVCRCEKKYEHTVCASEASPAIQRRTFFSLEKILQALVALKRKSSAPQARF